MTASVTDEPQINGRIKVTPSLIQHHLDKLLSETITPPNVISASSTSSTIRHVQSTSQSAEAAYVQHTTTDSSSPTSSLAVFTTTTSKVTTTFATTVTTFVTTSTVATRWEPSNLSLSPSDSTALSFKDLFMYLIIGCVALVMTLVACIMSGITGIMCYQKGRRKLDPEPQPRSKHKNRTPVIEHPNIELGVINPQFNHSSATPVVKTADITTDSKIVPLSSKAETTLPQGTILSKPIRSSRSAGAGSRINIMEDRYATGPISLEEHLYDRISLHRRNKRKKEMDLDGNEMSTMSSFDGFSMTTSCEEETGLTIVDEVKNADSAIQLTDSEQELADKLGSTKTDVHEHR